MNGLRDCDVAATEVGMERVVVCAVGARWTFLCYDGGSVADAAVWLPEDGVGRSGRGYF